MVKRTTIEIVTSLFVVLWVYTGLNKLLDEATFRSQLERSPFTQPLAGFIAVVLPYVELLLAALLVYKRSRVLALYFSYGLMLLFTGFVWLMLNFAYDLPCSCGGVVSSLSWTAHVWFNAAFTLLATFDILLETNTLFPIRRKEALT